MSFKCKIGLHSWNGCKCSECGKISENQHDWSKDCAECSKCVVKPEKINMIGHMTARSVPNATKPEKINMTGQRIAKNVQNVIKQVQTNTTGQRIVINVQYAIKSALVSIHGKRESPTISISFLDVNVLINNLILKNTKR